MQRILIGNDNARDFDALFLTHLESTVDVRTQAHFMTKCNANPGTPFAEIPVATFPLIILKLGIDDRIERSMHILGRLQFCSDLRVALEAVFSRCFLPNDVGEDLDASWSSEVKGTSAHGAELNWTFMPSTSYSTDKSNVSHALNGAPYQMHAIRCLPQSDHVVRS